MKRSDFQLLTSCLSWIEDEDRRVGVMELVADHFRDDPEFNAEEFKGWVQEKVFLNLRDSMFAGVPQHHVSASCAGRRCEICGDPSTHKVGEEILHDDPCPNRHNYTAYVCCNCFEMIFGPAVLCRK